MTRSRLTENVSLKCLLTSSAPKITSSEGLEKSTQCDLHQTEESSLDHQMTWNRNGNNKKNLVYLSASENELSQRTSPSEGSVDSSIP